MSSGESDGKAVDRDDFRRNASHNSHEEEEEGSCKEDEEEDEKEEEEKGNKEDEEGPVPNAEVIHEPTEVDVLCGRGGMSNHHPWGNEWFRRLIKSNRPLYRSCPKHTKLLVSKAIVQAVEQQGGRFLDRNAKTGTWYVVRYKRAVDKTSQGLRERDRDGDEDEGERPTQPSQLLPPTTITTTTTTTATSPTITAKVDNHSNSTMASVSALASQQPAPNPTGQSRILLPQQQQQQHQPTPFGSATATHSAGFIGDRFVATIPQALQHSQHYGTYLHHPSSSLTMSVPPPPPPPPPPQQQQQQQHFPQMLSQQQQQQQHLQNYQSHFTNPTWNPLAPIAASPYAMPPPNTRFMPHHQQQSPAVITNIKTGPGKPLKQHDGNEAGNRNSSSSNNNNNNNHGYDGRQPDEDDYAPLPPTLQTRESSMFRLLKHTQLLPAWQQSSTFAANAPMIATTAPMMVPPGGGGTVTTTTIANSGGMGSVAMQPNDLPTNTPQSGANSIREGSNPSNNKDASNQVLSDNNTQEQTPAPVSFQQFPTPVMIPYGVSPQGQYLTRTPSAVYTQDGRLVSTTYAIPTSFSPSVSGYVTAPAPGQPFGQQAHPMQYVAIPMASGAPSPSPSGVPGHMGVMMTGTSLMTTAAMANNPMSTQPAPPPPLSRFTTQVSDWLNNSFWPVHTCMNSQHSLAFPLPTTTVARPVGEDSVNAVNLSTEKNGTVTNSDADHVHLSMKGADTKKRIGPTGEAPSRPPSIKKSKADSTQTTTIHQQPVSKDSPNSIKLIPPRPIPAANASFPVITTVPPPARIPTVQINTIPPLQPGTKKGQKTNGRNLGTAGVTFHESVIEPRKKGTSEDQDELYNSLSPPKDGSDVGPPASDVERSVSASLLALATAPSGLLKGLSSFFLDRRETSSSSASTGSQVAAGAMTAQDINVVPASSLLSPTTPVTTAAVGFRKSQRSLLDDDDETEEEARLREVP